MFRTEVQVCQDPSKRLSLQRAGQAIVASAMLPTLGLAIPRSARAAFWVAPTLTFLLGYGLSELAHALRRSEQRYAQQRLRDRMGAFAWSNRHDVDQLQMHLGGSGDSPSLATLLAWPELGYHAARATEGASYSHPVNPPDRLALSDRDIFEEALRKRAPGLTNNPKAYARDYRDRDGNAKRIVAAQLEGRTVVAESDGRKVTAYEVEVARG